MRENLARRMSGLSASSLANLTTSVGALSDVRQQYLEKRSWEEQINNKEIQEEKQNEKQNTEEDQKEKK